METSPEKFFAQYHREPGLPEGVLRCTLFLKSIGIIVGIISGHRVCGIEIGGFRIGSTCCEPLRKEIWWRKVETEGNQWYPISLLQERSTYEESLFLPFFSESWFFSLFLSFSLSFSFSFSFCQIDHSSSISKAQSGYYFKTDGTIFVKGNNIPHLQYWVQKWARSDPIIQNLATMCTSWLKTITNSKFPLIVVAIADLFLWGWCVCL